VTKDSDPAAVPPPAAPKQGLPTEKGYVSGGLNPVVAALDDREDTASGPNPIIELWLPLGLIVLGLIVRLVQEIYFTDSPAEGIVNAIIVISVEVVITVPLLLVGLFAAVKLLDLAFGPLGKALFKLLAVVLGPSAVAAIAVVLLGGSLFAVLIGGFISFGIYWGLLTVLFGLEALEAIYLIIIIWVIQYIASLLLFAVIFSVTN
jgi:hypothetical protein